MCPDDYVPRNGCVTPDHLYNMSDTTYRFVPAFKMLPDQVIRFYAVSNIVLDTAGPDRASISCLGENSGFYFERVQGLTIRNLEFIDCAVRNVSYDAHYIYVYSSLLIDCTICINISTDVQLDNVAFERGKSNAYSVLATDVYGNITISNATFRHLQGPAVLIKNDKSCEKFYQRGCSENMQATIADSVFDSATYNERVATPVQSECFAIHLVLSGVIDPSANIGIRISNVSVTNNTHYSETHGIYIESQDFYGLALQVDIVVDRIRYENNHALHEFVGETLDHSEVTLRLPEDDNTYVRVKWSNLSFCNNTVETTGEDYKLMQFIGGESDAIISLTIANVTILNNIGHSSVIYTDFMTAPYARFASMDFIMDSLNISGNIFYISDVLKYVNTGLLHFRHTQYLAMQNCSIENNKHPNTALLLEGIDIFSFGGINTIRGNIGYTLLKTGCSANTFLGVGPTLAMPPPTGCYVTPPGVYYTHHLRCLEASPF